MRGRQSFSRPRAIRHQTPKTGFDPCSRWSQESVTSKWALDLSSLCLSQGMSSGNSLTLAPPDSRGQRDLPGARGSGELARIGRLSEMALEVQQAWSLGRILSIGAKSVGD